jgi:hypothetical protein
MRYLKVFAPLIPAVFFLSDKAWSQDVLSFTREDISLGETIRALTHIDSGDFNGDGHTDLVIGALNSAISSSQVFVVLGNGDGSFQPAQSAITGASFSTAVADFNNDGWPDLAAGVEDAIQIRLGNGDGTFRAAPNLDSAPTYPAGVVAGDFNRDGKQDLAASVFNNGRTVVRIYIGRGDGAFAQCKDIVQGHPGALAVADFNGDGERDVAAVDTIIENNLVGRRMLVLLGNGDGTFEPVSRQTAVAPESFVFTLGDFNNDGRPDVATADPNADVLSVVLGNGDGTFQDAQTLLPGVKPDFPGSLVQPMAIKVADFNGDGRQDLATANRRPSDPYIDSSAGILLGRGDGTFELAQEFPTRYGAGALAVADFNNDGRPDLALANHESSSLTVLIAGPMNLPLAVADWNGPTAPPASSSSERASSGGGSFGLELWLLSAIVSGAYVRRRRVAPLRAG